jgi:hypothetical protein
MDIGDIVQAMLAAAILLTALAGVCLILTVGRKLDRIDRNQRRIIALMIEEDAKLLRASQVLNEPQEPTSSS